MNALISKEIIKHKIPDPEENNRLAVLAKSGDEAAKDKVVLYNLRLVMQLVNKYKQSTNNEDDLFQTGVYGILRAINTYDEKKGLFSTHAFFWIKAMILKSFIDMEDFHYESVFYNKCIRYKKLKAATGQNDSMFTQSKLHEFNLTKKDIIQIEQFSRKSYSLEALTEDDSYSLGGIANDKIYNPNDCVENKIYEKEVKQIVLQEMERILNKHEQFVIQEIYGMENNEPLTMVKVAELFEKAFNKKISRQGIQQIKTTAEKKLLNSSVLKSLFFSN